MKQGDPIRQSAAVSMLLMAVLFFALPAAVAPFRTELFFGDEVPRETARTPVPDGGLDGQVTLRVLNGETVEEMTLEDYLLGVIRAEMPASFELEALKAQTVAARTYTLYKMNTGGNHGEAADLCTNSACCQAYLAQEAAWANWGTSAEVYEAKMTRAVAETDGQVLLYGGEPILAVFHSSSSGKTRGAEMVWQEELPYLRPVVSPEEDSVIPNYYSRADFSLEAFQDRILAELPEADLSGGAEGWLSHVGTDDTGSVDTLTVGGVAIKGSRLRGILGLRSACFTWEVHDGMISFYVTGYGHGVGMSQYGANRMAAEGADYRAILSHYYTGVTIDAWNTGESFAIAP